MYGGRPVTVKTHISTYYMVHDCLPRDLLLEGTTYCNGRFYFLHVDAVNSLLQYKTDICKRVIEDHAIGYYLSDSYKENMLQFESKHIFEDNT